MKRSGWPWARGGKLFPYLQRVPFLPIGQIDRHYLFGLVARIPKANRKMDSQWSITQSGKLVFSLFLITICIRSKMKTSSLCLFMAGNFIFFDFWVVSWKWSILQTNLQQQSYNKYYEELALYKKYSSLKPLSLFKFLSVFVCSSYMQYVCLVWPHKIWLSFSIFCSP